MLLSYSNLVVSTACPGLALGFDGGLKRPPTDALRSIIPNNACILCPTAVVGTESADAYSLDTIIASSPRKEVHVPWAFYLHSALLCFWPLRKILHAAYSRSLGRVFSSSVYDHPLGPAIDHRLGKLLPHS
ncbi:UNVERIFIED_CONTAM: hypothetical protein Slati_3230300 [Sesamum latifolium]|uniref:Uncharacterized protein n=1 Tax=Sesamum latifolium TaxID=2727402 RepID=A0AAW2UY87_9LAMI